MRTLLLFCISKMQPDPTVRLNVDKQLHTLQHSNLCLYVILLTLFHLASGKEQPQGWSCTARPRHTGKSAGNLDFVYDSPLQTTFRSRIAAWQACGLLVQTTEDDGAPAAKRMKKSKSPGAAVASHAQVRALSTHPNYNNNL